MKNLVTGKYGVNNFDPQDVLYLRGDANYSRVHLLSGQILVSSRTLKLFTKVLTTLVRIRPVSTRKREVWYIPYPSLIRPNNSFQFNQQIGTGP